MPTVALVVADTGSLNITDSSFQTWLSDVGFTVTLLADNGTEDKAYDLIVISESVVPADVGTKWFPDTAGDPAVIMCEKDLIDDWGVSTGAAGTAVGSQTDVAWLTGAEVYIDWTGQAENSTVTVLDTAREFFMVADASLSADAIALMDNTALTGTYLAWLPTGSAVDTPATSTAPILWFGLAGANATLPVTDANAAYEQLFKDAAGQMLAGQTVSVHKTTGEYSTVQAALDAADVTNGYWRVMITDAAQYTESIDVDTITGTPTIDRYVWLTAAPDVRHGGDAGVGARIVNTGAGNVFTLANGAGDFFRCEWLEVKISNNSDSTEGFRLAPGVDDVLISHCIIWTSVTTSANDQDGIHMTSHSSTNSVSVDNCVFSGWQRAGINVQQFTTATSPTYTVNIDHCSFYKNGDFNGTEPESAAVMVVSDDASDTITINMSNCAAGETQENGTDFRDFADGPAGNRTVPEGSVTWNGSHNLTAFENVFPLSDIDGTNNITDWQEAISGVSGTSQTSGSYWVIAATDDTNPIDSYDLRPLNDTDAGNLVLRNGIGRLDHAPPDPRQDFSRDIAGNYRPTSRVDIGAYQITQGPVIVQKPSDNTNSSSGNTDQTTAWTTDTTAGNMLFAVFTTQADDDDVLTPAGWTKINSANPSTGGNRGSVSVFAKIAAAAEASVTVYIAQTLTYTGGVVNGSINVGNGVTQETTGATGTVLEHDTVGKVIILRDTTGTFATGATTHTLTDDTAGGSVEIDDTVTQITEATCLALLEVSGLDTYALPAVGYNSGLDVSTSSTDGDAVIADFSAQNDGDALFYGFYGRGEGWWGGSALPVQPILPDGFVEEIQRGGSNAAIGVGADLDGGSTTIQDYNYEDGDWTLTYTGSVTGSINVGNGVTQETTGATGTVLEHDTVGKIIRLRDTTGTFATGATTHTLTDDTTGGTVEIDGTADVASGSRFGLVQWSWPIAPDAGDLPYEYAVVADGPEHFYRFQSNDTDNLDFSLNSNNNTPPTGGPFLFGLDGPTGNYLSMDGFADGYDTTAGTLGPATFSVEAVVKAKVGGSTDYIAGNDSGGGSTRPWMMRVDTNGDLTAFANVQSGPTITTTGTDLRDGAWHHIVFTHSWTTGDTNHYVDGIRVTTDAAGNTSQQTNGTMGVGELRPGLGMWQGLMAEFAYYTSVLTPTQVQAHAAAAGLYDAPVETGPGVSVPAQVLRLRFGQARAGLALR